MKKTVFAAVAALALLGSSASAFALDATRNVVIVANTGEVDLQTTYEDDLTFDTDILGSVSNSGIGATGGVNYTNNVVGYNAVPNKMPLDLKFANNLLAVVNTGDVNVDVTYEGTVDLTDSIGSSLSNASIGAATNIGGTNNYIR